MAAIGLSTQACGTTGGAAVCGKIATPKAAVPESLVDVIPHQSLLAVVMRRGALSIVDDFHDQFPTVRKDLAALYRRRIGPDLTRVEGVVAFLVLGKGGKKGVAVFSRISDPKPFIGRKVGEHGGVTLVAEREKSAKAAVFAAMPRGLLMGDREAVIAGIDRLQKRTPAISKDDPLGGLLAAPPRAQLIAVGNAKLLPQQALAQFGLTQGSVTLTRDLQLAIEVKGDPERLPLVERLLNSLVQRFMRQLTLKKEKAMAKQSTGEVVGALIAHGIMAKYVAETKPKIVGDRLVASVKLPKVDAMMSVAVIGMLAAVSIPAFIKYLRKSKTVEATEALDKLKAGAKAYFQADHYDKSGNLLKKRFPVGDTGWVPAMPCCKGEGKKCAPGSGTLNPWNKSPWRQLQFALAEPHYFQYRYRSSGTGRQSRFSVEARADLDCDGKYSNYRIQCQVDAQYGIRCTGPIINDEIE